MPGIGSDSAANPALRCANAVLVVEHEQQVAELERRYLSRAGWPVRVETDPDQAPGEMSRPDLAAAVLDLSMPGLDGPRLWRQGLAMGLPAVLVFSEERQVARLGAQPTACLRKPFAPRALVAGVRDAILAASRVGWPIHRIDRIAVDSASGTVRVDGRPVRLTVTEVALLGFLVRRPGRAYTRRQLLSEVWPEGSRVGARTVDVHVAQLRAKLGDASPIKTVRGIGYMADDASDAAAESRKAADGSTPEHARGTGRHRAPLLADGEARATIERHD